MQEEDVAVDYHSKIGQVRVLIPDLEEVDWDDSGTSSYLFEDPQLEALLDLNDGRVRLAAADAVEAVAFSEALISKVIKTEEIGRASCREREQISRVEEAHKQKNIKKE